MSGPSWPVAGAGPVGGLAIVGYCLALLALGPMAWAIVRKRFGRLAAGPLWPLLLFLVVAGAYALVNPPWQAPDEPQHMLRTEVVRRTGFLGDLGHPPPRANAALQASASDIVHSMQATDASRFLPDGASAIRGGRVPGPAEYGHEPLYYAVAGAITRPLSSVPVLGRLAVLRAFGIALGMCTLWACGRVGRVLWPRSPIGEVPLALALAVATFVGFAGSANDDVLATLIGAFLILVLVMGVTDRAWMARPWLWASLIAVLIVAGFITKRTVLPLAIPAVVAIALRLRVRPRLLLAIGIGAVFVAGVAVATLSTPRVAFWQSSSPDPHRCRKGPGDTWALCLSGRPLDNVRQDLPRSAGQDLAGGQASLEFSTSASGPNQYLGYGIRADGRRLAADVLPIAPGGWQQQQVSANIPADAKDVWVEFIAAGGKSVYVNNVLLRAAGPAFEGSVEPNELRNGSGAGAVRGSSMSLPDPLRSGFNSEVALIHDILLDGRRQSDALDFVVRGAPTTYGTFWATVGWEVPSPVLPVPLLWVLGALTAVAAAGVVVTILRRTLPLPAMAVLVAAAAATALSLMVRATSIVPVVSGRYVFPALPAIVVLLTAGWAYFWPWSAQGLRTAGRVSIAAMHALFLAFLFVPFVLK